MPQPQTGEPNVICPLLVAVSLLANADGPTPAETTGAETPGVVAPPATIPTDAAAARAPRFRRIAVYDLQMDGVDPRIGRFITDALVVELRKLDGISVVAMDEVRAMLEHEAQKQLLGCADGECQSPMGEVLGADEILVGTLSVAADSSVLTLRRIDQVAARPMATVSKRLKPLQGEEFLAAIGPAIDTLFPGHPLRSGQTRGVAPEVVSRLNPPPLPLWAPIITAASSLVIVVGAAAFGLTALSEESAQKALLQQSKNEPVPGSLVLAAGERASNAALVANVLYGSAAVVGLGAAAMLPFTRFDVAE